MENEYNKEVFINDYKNSKTVLKSLNCIYTYLYNAGDLTSKGSPVKLGQTSVISWED